MIEVNGVLISCDTFVINSVFSLSDFKLCSMALVNPPAISFMYFAMIFNVPSNSSSFSFTFGFPSYIFLNASLIFCTFLLYCNNL